MAEPRKLRTFKERGENRRSTENAASRWRSKDRTMLRAALGRGSIDCPGAPGKGMEGNRHFQQLQWLQLPKAAPDNTCRCPQVQLGCGSRCPHAPLHPSFCSTAHTQAQLPARNARKAPSFLQDTQDSSAQQQQQHTPFSTAPGPAGQSHTPEDRSRDISMVDGPGRTGGRGRLCARLGRGQVSLWPASTALHPSLGGPGSAVELQATSGVTAKLTPRQPSTHKLVSEDQLH